MKAQGDISSKIERRTTKNNYTQVYIINKKPKKQKKNHESSWNSLTSPFTTLNGRLKLQTRTRCEKQNNKMEIRKITTINKNKRKKKR